ncbi:SCO1/SenC-domain-containing protein [Protomyces lactucae-debilis]|uniref:SCO1/SenC-domain-containing protein n=1 Tax=Protomyces lactucae-debilis TaxID=2754530 RepID=A0A1Y2FUT9_PROLT|nr:SCO1/SenC-domain-containing protein [Protomyces lactucae-debilis]ORY87770.1 SCO1/SenC-domain-containing protein [Protomyces lactucae-debilis]
MGVIQLPTHTLTRLRSGPSPDAPSSSFLSEPSRSTLPSLSSLSSPPRETASLHNFSASGYIASARIAATSSPSCKVSSSRPVQAKNQSKPAGRLVLRRTFTCERPRLQIRQPAEVKEKARVGPFSVTSAALFVATALILGLYFNSERKRVKVQQAMESQKPVGKPRIGGPYSLIDHNGKGVSEKDYLGLYTLIYFGFTRCPDICPEELDKMTLVLKDVNQGTKRVQPLFITCDPARDTPEELKEYLSEFDPDIIGLTGDYEAIKSVCKAFRVYFSTPKEVKSGEDYLVDHSIFFYLMDPEGQFVDAFGRNYTAEQAAKRMKEYIQDWAPRTPAV